MPRRLLAAVLLLLLAAGSAFYGWTRFVPAVTVTRPMRGPAVEAVYATGTVEPEQWAKVSPILAGRVAEICVQEGQEVTQGQLLARLDDREAQARLLEMEAREHYWRDQLARQKALAERGVASREMQERTQSDYLAAQAAAVASRQRLADLAILSPMAGTVLRHDGEVGEVLDKQQVLFWIGRKRPLRVTADIDEEDIARLKVGQRALIKADAFPGQALEGTVSQITPKGDPLNKSFRVRVALPDETPVMVGMTVEVNVVIREVAETLLLPPAAVAGGRVFIVNGHRAHARSVTSGIQGRRAIEIASGLAGDEMIILDPPKGLKDGDRVRIADSPATPNP